MNYFSFIYSEKLYTHTELNPDGTAKESKILINRVNKRIEFALKKCKMKFYHKQVLYGLGKICLILTSKPVTDKFAENLFFSQYEDCETNKPVFVLPKDWKEKKINSSISLEMDKIK